MRTSTTTSANLLSGGFRLDASYHANEGGKAFYLLNRWKSFDFHSRRLDSVGDVCLSEGIFIGGRAKRIYVNDPRHGIPFLSSSDMLLASLDGVKLISKNQPDINSLLLRPGWTLISRSGTIGNTAYVRSDMNGLAGSEHIMRVVADPKKILPGYLYAFLSSDIGVSMIRQGTFGAVIDTIEPKYIASLPIPRLNPVQEERIHQLIEQAADLRVNANQLINLARRRVNQFVDLPELTREESLTKGCWNFSVPGKQFGQYSLTAWTYNPVSQKLIRQIESGPYKNLEELIEEDGIYYGHQFKRIEASSAAGVILLSQSDVFQERPQGRWISKKSVLNYHDYEVSDGTILVAAQGTMGDNELFGHCQFSHGNFADKMITQHILRIVPDPDKVSPGYLFAFLSSSYGFQLFRRTSCGTKLMGFILGLVGKIPVPLVERSDQDEIGRMINHAYECRGKAIELEDQAQEVLRTVLF